MTRENGHQNIEQITQVASIRAIAEAIRNPAFTQSQPPEARPLGKLWPEVQRGENGTPKTRTLQEVREEYVVKQGEKDDVSLVDHLNSRLGMFIDLISPEQMGQLKKEGIIAGEDGNPHITDNPTPEQQMKFIASLIKQIEADGLDDMAILLSGDNIGANDALTCLQALGLGYAQQALDAINPPSTTKEVNVIRRKIARTPNGRLQISSKFSTPGDKLELSSARSSLFAVDKTKTLQNAEGIPKTFVSVQLEIAKAMKEKNFKAVPRILQQFENIPHESEGKQIQSRLGQLAVRLISEENSHLTEAQKTALKDLLPDLADPRQFKKALAITLPIESWIDNLNSTDKATRTDASKHLNGALYDWGQVMFGREGYQRTVEVDLRMAVGLQDVLLPAAVRLSTIKLEQRVADAKGKNEVHELSRSSDFQGVLKKLVAFDQGYIEATQQLQNHRQTERRAILLAADVSYEQGVPAVKPGDVDDTTQELADVIRRNMSSLLGKSVMEQNRVQTAEMLGLAGVTLTKEQISVLNAYLHSDAFRSSLKINAGDVLADMGIDPEDPNYALAKHIVAEGRRVGRALATLGKGTDSYAKTEDLKIGGTLLDMGLKGVEYLYRQGEYTTKTTEETASVETPGALEKGAIPTDVPVYDVLQSEVDPFGGLFDIPDTDTGITEPEVVAETTTNAAISSPQEELVRAEANRSILIIEEARAGKPLQTPVDDSKGTVVEPPVLIGERTDFTEITISTNPKKKTDQLNLGKQAIPFQIRQGSQNNEISFQADTKNPGSLIEIPDITKITDDQKSSLVSIVQNENSLIVNGTLIESVIDNTHPVILDVPGEPGVKLVILGFHPDTRTVDLYKYVVTEIEPSLPSDVTPEGEHPDTFFNQVIQNAAPQVVAVAEPKLAAAEVAAPVPAVIEAPSEGVSPKDWENLLEKRQEYYALVKTVDESRVTGSDPGTDEERLRMATQEYRVKQKEILDTWQDNNKIARMEALLYGNAHHIAQGGNSGDNYGHVLMNDLLNVTDSESIFDPNKAFEGLNRFNQIICDQLRVDENGKIISAPETPDKFDTLFNFYNNYVAVLEQTTDRSIVDYYSLLTNTNSGLRALNMIDPTTSDAHPPNATVVTIKSIGHRSKSLDPAIQALEPPVYAEVSFSPVPADETIPAPAVPPTTAPVVDHTTIQQPAVIAAPLITDNTLKGSEETIVAESTHVYLRDTPINDGPMSVIKNESKKVGVNSKLGTIRFSENGIGAIRSNEGDISAKDTVLLSVNSEEGSITANGNSQIFVESSTRGQVILLSPKAIVISTSTVIRAGRVGVQTGGPDMTGDLLRSNQYSLPINIVSLSTFINSDGSSLDEVAILQAEGRVIDKQTIQFIATNKNGKSKRVTFELQQVPQVPTGDGDELGPMFVMTKVEDVETPAVVATPPTSPPVIAQPIATTQPATPIVAVPAPAVLPTGPTAAAPPAVARSPQGAQSVAGRAESAIALTPEKVEQALSITTATGFREPLLNEGLPSQDRIICHNSWVGVVDGAGGYEGGDLASETIYDILKNIAEGNDHKFLDENNIPTDAYPDGQSSTIYARYYNFNGKSRVDAANEMRGLLHTLNTRIKWVNRENQLVSKVALAMGRVHLDNEGKKTLSYVNYGDCEIAIIRAGGTIDLLANKSVRTKAERDEDLSFYLSKREAATALIGGVPQREFGNGLSSAYGSISLFDGDRVVFLTDGVAEDLQNVRGTIAKPQKGPDGNMIGLDVLSTIPPTTPISEMPQAIFNILDEARRQTKNKELIKITASSSANGKLERVVVPIPSSKPGKPPFNLIVGGKGENPWDANDDGESIVVMAVNSATLPGENLSIAKPEASVEKANKALLETRNAYYQALDTKDQTQIESTMAPYRQAQIAMIKPWFDEHFIKIQKHLTDTSTTLNRPFLLEQLNTFHTEINNGKYDALILSSALHIVHFDSLQLSKDEPTLQSTKQLQLLIEKVNDGTMVMSPPDRTTYREALNGDIQIAIANYDPSDREKITQFPDEYAIPKGKRANIFGFHPHKDKALELKAHFQFESTLPPREIHHDKQALEALSTKFIETIKRLDHATIKRMRSIFDSNRLSGEMVNFYSGLYNIRNNTETFPHVVVEVLTNILNLDQRANYRSIEVGKDNVIRILPPIGHAEITTYHTLPIQFITIAQELGVGIWIDENVNFQTNFLSTIIQGPQSRIKAATAKKVVILTDVGTGSPSRPAEISGSIVDSLIVNEDGNVVIDNCHATVSDIKEGGNVKITGTSRVIIDNPSILPPITIELQSSAVEHDAIKGGIVVFNDPNSRLSMSLQKVDQHGVIVRSQTTNAAILRALNDSSVPPLDPSTAATEIESSKSNKMSPRSIKIQDVPYVIVPVQRIAGSKIDPSYSFAIMSYEEIRGSRPNEPKTPKMLRIAGYWDGKSEEPVSVNGISVYFTPYKKPFQAVTDRLKKIIGR